MDASPISTDPPAFVHLRGTELLIARYSLAGVAPSMMAEALGISESYVSQLRNSRTVSEALRATRPPDVISDLDDEADDLQLSLLRDLRMEAKYMKSHEKVRLLQTVGGLKRRGGAVEEPAPQGATTVKLVQINMPVSLTFNNSQQALVLNKGPEGSGEQQVLVPADPSQVRALLAPTVIDTLSQLAPQSGAKDNTNEPRIPDSRPTVSPSGPSKASSIWDLA